MQPGQTEDEGLVGGRVPSFDPDLPRRAVTRCAYLLRAVNVSGKRQISMPALREIFGSLGCTDVETYLQSGNVVAGSKIAPSKIAQKSVAAIAEKFGYEDVTVLAWSSEQLHALIEANPFVQRGCDPAKLHATFLGRDTSPADLTALATDAFLPDEFAVGKRAVYVHCPGGYGRTKLNNAFFERKLGIPATTRNWNTVSNLLAFTRR
ncbi:MAG: hypothetical protein JWN04_2649 [Myxococcaceae bacterium]|nr:hypothetical protein [Myxococcaceae bacterium]